MNLTYMFKQFLINRRQGYWFWKLSLIVLLFPLTAWSQDAELLPADQAFAFQAQVVENGINARWDIADGYYMYRNKLAFSLKDESGIAIPIQYEAPVSEIKNDPSFGEVEIFHDRAEFLISVAASNQQAVILSVDGQGCNEPVGVCYPPMHHEVPLTLLASTANSTPVMAEMSEKEPSGKSFQAVGWVMLTAFIAGLGLTFTPCVLPLIPILSSVIAGQGDQLTKAKAVSLASTYVLGTAITYAVIGAFAGATGEQLQAYFQNVWAIGAMVLVFFIMALSMFGLFTVQMPAFIQTRLSTGTQGIKGGSMPTAFVLGLLSALIVGACVSPILISFLSLAIAKGSASLGAMTMFSMAAGMGVPLIVLALGAGHLLPKAGMWMENVKTVFGVLLLGVGIYLLSALPTVPVLYLWAVLLIVVAVYMGATQSLPEEVSAWQKLQKGLASLLLLWGGFALVGAFQGQRDILHPLPDQLFVSTLNTNTQGVQHEADFIQISSLKQLDRLMADAQQADKFVMIDYYADWCTDCIRLEQNTFADPNVQSLLAGQFVALQVDVTDPKDLQAKALKRRYGVFGPPAVLFFDQDGQPLKNQSFYGYKAPQDFISHVRGQVQNIL